MIYKTFFYCILLLLICDCYSQKITGSISSNGNFVEYANIRFKNSNKLIYANEKGGFKIEPFSDNDTLMVECIGYVSKEIPLKNQSNNLIIELEQHTEVLEEITISINSNEKSKWRKVNKRTKRYDQTHEGLPEGFILISSYKIDEGLKFNGIRLFIMVNTLNPDGSLNKKFKKIVRPILIINSDDLDNNILPNKIIYLNKDVDLFTKIDIEFANTLHLQPGETLTIGLELIPENLENPNTNNVMGVLTTKYLLSESKTFLKKISSKKVNANSRRLNEDLYFELKVVK